jgi:quercetin dioxygenase-like cupin family protein
LQIADLNCRFDSIGNLHSAIKVGLILQVFRHQDSPLRPADSKSFVGPAQTTLLASSDAGTPVHVYRVVFDERARTHWHIHSGPQWLLVVEGRIRAQVEGEPAHDLENGDAVVFAAGEKHWHGAAPGSRGAHLAVNVNVKTRWLEPVTDEQYQDAGRV